jgi:hypothetical protein
MGSTIFIIVKSNTIHLAVYYPADVLYYDNYVETHINNTHFFNTNTKYNPGVKWEHLLGDLKVAVPL